MCFYNNINDLLSLTENQIFIKLDGIILEEDNKNSGNSNQEFKVNKFLCYKNEFYYKLKKHSIITNCFETIMGGWGCYSPGKEQGISEHLINM